MPPGARLEAERTTPRREDQPGFKGPLVLGGLPAPFFAKCDSGERLAAPSASFLVCRTGTNSPHSTAVGREG